MTPSLPLHGVASALFRRKYVPGAGLRPEWRYWSLRQAGAYLGPDRGWIEESVALLVPTQGSGQRSRQISFRRRGTRRKVRVFLAHQLEGRARAHRGGLPTARRRLVWVRQIFNPPVGWAGAGLSASSLGRDGQGQGRLARKRAKRRSEKENQKGEIPP